GRERAPRERRAGRPRALDAVHPPGEGQAGRPLGVPRAGRRARERPARLLEESVTGAENTVRARESLTASDTGNLDVSSGAHAPRDRRSPAPPPRSCALIGLDSSGLANESPL